MTGGDDLGPVGGAGDDIAPGVDDHGVGIGLELGLDPALGWGHHIAAVLNGAGAQNGLPVVLARGHGEVGGGHQNLGPLQSHDPVQLGEADVVADGQAQTAHLAGVHRDNLPAGQMRSDSRLTGPSGMTTSMPYISLSGKPMPTSTI